MVPAGCLECFSLRTSSPRRRRLVGWGSLGHGAEGREKTASRFCLRVQIFPAEERNWYRLVLLFNVLFSASPFIPMCQTACRLYCRGQGIWTTGPNTSGIFWHTKWWSKVQWCLEPAPWQLVAQKESLRCRTVLDNF